MPARSGQWVVPVCTEPLIFTQTSSSSLRCSAVSPVREATARRHLVSGLSAGGAGLVLVVVALDLGVVVVAVDLGVVVALVEVPVVGVLRTGATEIADGLTIGA